MKCFVGLEAAKAKSHTESRSHESHESQKPQKPDAKKQYLKINGPPQDIKEPRRPRDQETTGTKRSKGPGDQDKIRARDQRTIFV